MTLSLIPEVFNAIDVIALVGEELGVVDSHVAEVAHLESVVGLERIGIDDTVGLRLLPYDRQEGGGSGVGNDRSRPSRPSLPQRPWLSSPQRRAR
jgi:hypothetical protein